VTPPLEILKIVSLPNGLHKIAMSMTFEKYYQPRQYAHAYSVCVCVCVCVCACACVCIRTFRQKFSKISLLPNVLHHLAVGLTFEKFYKAWRCTQYSTSACRRLRQVRQLSVRGPQWGPTNFIYTQLIYLSSLSYSIFEFVEFVGRSEVHSSFIYTHIVYLYHVISRLSVRGPQWGLSSLYTHT